MNVFDSLTVYAGKWNVSASRKFNSEEIAMISSAVVVDSEYGKSVCFFLLRNSHDIFEYISYS